MAKARSRVVLTAIAVLALALSGDVKATGDLSVVTTLGSTGADVAVATIVDASGNVFVTGTFEGTVDFDPSDSNVTLSSAGERDVFVAKYSSTGALVWARRLGGSGNERSGGLARNSLVTCKNPPCEIIYATGWFEGTADFDPGNGVARLRSEGFTDVFVCALNSSGNYVWARRLGGIGVDAATDITSDKLGNVYATGFFTGTVDFDSGAGTDEQESAGGADLFVAKLDRTGNHVWSRRMGGSEDDGAGGITVDGSGDVYITGSFRGAARLVADELTSSGDDDVFVLKLSRDGELTWVKQLGGTGADVGNDIDTDSSGNVYVTGTFRGRMDFDPGNAVSRLTSAGDDDIFISKLTGRGNHVWARRAGGNGVDRGYGITTDPSGNVYVTGSFNGALEFDPDSSSDLNLSSAGREDVFVLKLNANGIFAWGRGIGGNESDASSDVALSSSNRLVIAGSFTGTADFNPRRTQVNRRTSGGGTDAFFVTLTQGTPDLGFALGVGADEDDVAHGMIADSAGNVYVTGAFRNTVDFNPRGPARVERSSSSFDLPDVFVAKYSPVGSLIWVQTLGGTGFDAGFDVATDGESFVYVTGRFEDVAFINENAQVRVNSAGDSDIFVWKLGAAGETIWAHSMGGPEEDVGYSIAVDSNGNVCTTGIFRGVADFAPGDAANITVELTSAGGEDAFVSKLYSDGYYAWAGRIGGSNHDYGQSIAVDSFGNMYLAGSFRRTADFNPGLSTHELTSAGQDDIFIVKLSNTGEFNWARRVGSTGVDLANGLALDSSGNIYTTGTFQDRVDFNPDPDPNTTVHLTSVGGTYDAFVLKLNNAGHYGWARAVGGIGLESGDDIAVDSSSNVYLTGSFSGSADFNPSDKVAFFLNSVENTPDIFVLKLSGAGAFTYAVAMGGRATEGGLAVAVDGYGNTYIAGLFRDDTVDFDPSDDTFLLDNVDDEDAFLMKLVL